MSDIIDIMHNKHKTLNRTYAPHYKDIVSVPSGNTIDEIYKTLMYWSWTRTANRAREFVMVEVSFNQKTETHPGMLGVRTEKDRYISPCLVLM